MAYSIERRTGERGTAGGHRRRIGIIEMSVTFVCKLEGETFRYWHSTWVFVPYITIIIIIIIIWHYNPLWVFAFSAKSLQVLLSLAISFQFLTFSFFKSSITSFCHRCLGLPAGLVPMGFHSNSFLVGLSWSILWICPSHLILCALMNLTTCAPSVSLSIAMLFRILHILSLLTGPNFCDLQLSSIQTAGTLSVGRSVTRCFANCNQEVCDQLP